MLGYKGDINQLNISGDSQSKLLEDISTRTLESVTVGEEAGKISRGEGNAFVGYQAGKENTFGSFGVFVGFQAGQYNQNSDYNTFVGAFSGRENNRGFRNTFVGYEAGQLNKDGSDCTAVGAFALRENTVGLRNVAIGNRAGERVLDGDNNTMIGMEAGQDIRSGNNNTMAGYRSGRASFRNNENTYFGAYAGYSNSIGDGNAFIGYRAGENLMRGNYNVAVGTYALHNAQYGDCNIAIGAFAGSVTTGGNSVFVGSGAGSQNLNGDNNTYIGTNAGYKSQGSDNVYIGKNAACNLTGNQNVVIGVNAYEDIQSDSSVIIGYRTGTTKFNFGNSNILIGINADTYTQRTSNAIVIGSKNTKAYHQSISIGENIENGGINSLSIGYDINIDGDKSIIVGNQIDVKGVVLFNDALNYRFPVQNTQNYDLFNLQEEYTDTLIRNGFSNEVAIATINSINLYDSGRNIQQGNTLTSNINILDLFDYSVLYQGRSFFYNGTNNTVFNITDYFLNPSTNNIRTVGTNFSKSNLFLNSSNQIINYGLFNLQDNIAINVDTCNVRISGQLLPFLINPTFLVSCNLVPSQNVNYNYRLETIKRNSIYSTTQNSNYYISFESLLPIRTSSNKIINSNEVDNLNVTYSRFEYLDTPPLYGNYSNAIYYNYKEGYFSSNDRLKISIVNKISYGCNNYYITSSNEAINTHFINYNSNYNLYVASSIPVFSGLGIRYDLSYLHMHPKSNLTVSFRNTNPSENIILGVNNIVGSEFLDVSFSNSIVDLTAIPFSQQNPSFDINNYPLEVTVLNNTYNVNLVYDEEIEKPITSYQNLSMTILPYRLDTVSSSSFIPTDNLSKMSIISYPRYGTIDYTLTSVSYTPAVINIDTDQFQFLVKYSKYNRRYYNVTISMSNLFVTTPMHFMQEPITSNLINRTISSNILITRNIQPLTTLFTSYVISSNNPYGDSDIITYSNIPILSYNCNIGYISASNHIIYELYEETIKPLYLDIPNTYDVIDNNGIDYFIYNPYPPYSYDEIYSFSSNPIITSNIITSNEYIPYYNNSNINRYYYLDYYILSQKYYSQACNTTVLTSNYTRINNTNDYYNRFIYTNSNNNITTISTTYTLLPSIASNVVQQITTSNLSRQRDAFNVVIPALLLNKSYVYENQKTYTIDYSKTSNHLLILQKNRGPIQTFHQSNINNEEIYVWNTHLSDALPNTISTSNVYFTDNKSISINYYKNTNTLLTPNRPLIPIDFINYTNLQKESYIFEYEEDYTNIAIQSTSNITFVIRETEGASVFFNTTLSFDPTTADIYALPDNSVSGNGYIEYINYKIDINGDILYGKPIRKTLKTAYQKSFPIFYNTNFSYNPLTYVSPNNFYYTADSYPIILYKVVSQNNSFKLKQNVIPLQLNSFFTQEDLTNNTISIDYNSILLPDESLSIEIYTSNNILITTQNLQAKPYDIIDYYEPPNSAEVQGDIYIIQVKNKYLKTFSPSFWRNNILKNSSNIIPQFILTEPPRKGFLSYSNIQPITQIALSNLVNEDIYYIPYEPMQLENDMIRGVFVYDKTISPQYRFNIKNYHSIWEDFIITTPVYDTANIIRSRGMISDNVKWIPETISMLQQEPILSGNVIIGYTCNVIALPERNISFQLRYLGIESLFINETVRYLPITKQPSFTSNAITLNVDSGNFNNLTGLLSMINDPRQDVLFYITEPPSRGIILDNLEGKSFFTSSNIRTGNAFYQHFGENTSNDQFKVRVATTPWDASLIELTVNLTIIDQPFLLKNNNQYIYFDRLSDASNTYNLLSCNIIQLSSGYINIFEKRNIDLFKLDTSNYIPTTVLSKQDLDTNKIYYRPSQTFFQQGSNINESLTFSFNVNSDSVTTNFNNLGSYNIYANRYNFQWFSKINTYESENRILGSIDDLQVITYSNLAVNTPLNIFKANLKTEIQYDFLPFQNVFSLPDNPSFIKTYYYTYKLIDKNNESLLNAIFTHRGITVQTSNNPVLNIPAITFNNTSWNTFNITNYDPVNEDTLSIKLNNNNYTLGLNYTNLRLEDLKDIILEVPTQYDLFNFYLYQERSNVNNPNINIASNVYYYNLINYNTQLRFKDFKIFISPSDNTSNLTTNLFNIAIGDELNITGINNICLGKNFKTTGEGSIILGTNIGVDERNPDQQTNEIFNSIIISNDSFRNSFVRDVITIGNNILNDITATDANVTSTEIQRFLAKKPVLIGNDIGLSQIDFHVNFQNTFLKTTNNIPKIYCGLEGEEVYIAYTSNIKSLNEQNTEFKLHVNGGLEINGIFKQINSGTSYVKYVYGNILFNKGITHRYTKSITWTNVQATDYNSFTLIGKFKCISDKNEYSWHRFELLISSKNDDDNNKPNLLDIVDLVGYNTPSINSFNIVVSKTSNRSINLSLRFSTFYNLTVTDYVIGSLDLEIIHNTVLGDITIIDIQEVSEEELFGPRLLLIADVLTGTNNSVVSAWNGFQTYAVGGASLPVLRTNENARYVRFGTGGVSSIVGNYLDFGNSISWNLNTNNGFTFFGVIRNYNLTDNEQTVFSFDYKLGLFYYSPASKGMYVKLNDYVISQPYSITQTEWSLVGVRIKKDSVNTFQLEFYRNSNIYTSNDNSILENIITSTNNIGIPNTIGGGIYPGIGNGIYANIDIKEGLWYDKWLNDTETTEIVSYLRNKYSLNFSGLLDSIETTNIVNSYSLQLLNGNYYGPVIRVRRSIDNVEADVYCDKTGAITQVLLINGGTALYGPTALTSFKSNGTLYVHTWYDQFGLSHLINFTNSEQPILDTSDMYVHINNTSNSTIRLSYGNQFTLENATFIMDIKPVQAIQQNSIQWYNANPILTGNRFQNTNDFAIILQQGIQFGLGVGPEENSGAVTYTNGFNLQSIMALTRNSSLPTNNIQLYKDGGNTDILNTTTVSTGLKISNEPTYVGFDPLTSSQLNAKLKTLLYFNSIETRTTINSITRLLGNVIHNIPGLYAWYDANSFDIIDGTTRVWYDMSSNNRTISSSDIIGPITKEFNSNVYSISGGVDSSIKFFNATILPSEYTLFHVAKYNGSDRYRIFDGNGNNWLSGFWGGNAGVAYHGTDTNSSGMVLREYPPVALTGTSNIISGQSYGNGNYVVSQSTFDFNEPAWRMFDRNANTWWTTDYSNGGNYDWTTGWHKDSTFPNAFLVNDYLGQWARVQLPNSIIVTQYNITARNDSAWYRAPRNWRFYGSTNGSSWTLLNEQTDVFFTSGETKTFTIVPSLPYQYYGITIRRTGNASGILDINSLQIAALRLFGVDNTYTSWITPIQNIHGNDWVFSTDQNNLYRSNKVQRSISSTANASTQLTINAGSATNQRSQWAVAEVIVYNRTLNLNEIETVENYLTTKYTPLIPAAINRYIIFSAYNVGYFNGYDLDYSNYNRMTFIPNETITWLTFTGLRCSASVNINPLTADKLLYGVALYRRSNNQPWNTGELGTENQFYMIIQGGSNTGKIIRIDAATALLQAVTDPGPTRGNDYYFYFTTSHTSRWYYLRSVFNNYAFIHNYHYIRSTNSTPVQTIDDAFLWMVV